MARSTIVTRRSQPATVGENCYDVTKYPAGNAAEDIGAVINSIIADIKSRQANSDLNEGGKPGAVMGTLSITAPQTERRPRHA